MNCCFLLSTDPGGHWTDMAPKETSTKHRSAGVAELDTVQGVGTSQILSTPPTWNPTAHPGPKYIMETKCAGDAQRQ
jgi:hypothetical protein